MRLSKPISGRSSNAAMNLSTASMIDVVFLLLIFFLVTTSFRMPTRSLVTPIASQSASPDQIATDGIEPVILTIRSQNGEVGYELEGVKTGDAEVIRSVLEKMEPKTAPMFVKVGDGIPFQSATSLISMCRSCGHDSVAWFPNHER